MLVESEEDDCAAGACSPAHMLTSHVTERQFRKLQRSSADVHESMVWHTEIAFILGRLEDLLALAREYHMLTLVVWMSSPCK